MLATMHPGMRDLPQPPSPQVEFLEEVVAFVVDDDEGGALWDAVVRGGMRPGAVLGR